jgi:phosphatidate cytidylyltransferase
VSQSTARAPRILISRVWLVRIASSVALGVPAVLITLWGGWVFTLWVGLFGALMTYEWNAIAYPARRHAGFALHLAGLVAVLVLAGSGENLLSLLAIGLTALAGFVLTTREGQDGRWAGLGAVYLLLPVHCLIWLRHLALEPAAVVLWLLAVVWSSDIAAFAVGKTVGGPRLAPQLSPNKTWAGFGGAVAGGFCVGIAMGVLLGGHAAPLVLGPLGALLAVIGQLGDLTESAFKRHFGVKDSSSLIPGQGGVLDRVDGLMFATLAFAGLALVRGGDVLFLGFQP